MHFLSLARRFIRNHPVVSYFVLAFTISWAAALCVAAPQLLHRGSLDQLTRILMFPVMLLGPSGACIVLTKILEGHEGIRRLFEQIIRAGMPARWYAALLIPPSLILLLLFYLRTIISPIFAPNFFLAGVFFGVPAGFLEEIGWTGYAFPKMSREHLLVPSVALGLLWAAWHLPVINFLGTVTPHGSYWLPFFLSFAGAMTAMRVLICWMYKNTESVLIAQLMHMSSTGSLVVFSPPRVTASQEVWWYCLYGALLWLVVAVVLTHRAWKRRRLGGGDE